MQMYFVKHSSLPACLQHFQKGHRVGCQNFIACTELTSVSINFKNTILEDVSDWKDKDLPDTSKHYFKCLHPLFHSKVKGQITGLIFVYY